MPVKQKQKPKDKNFLQRNFTSEERLENEIKDADAQSLFEEAKSINLGQSSYLRSLFCIFGCKNRSERLKSKAIERFDEKLDVRSVVATHINVATLLRLFFDHKQKLLFDHQHHRATTLYTLDKD